jgi:ribosomal protein S18 acetylase RimI-like enzyme
MDKDENQIGNATITMRDATQSDGAFTLWLEQVCMQDYAIALWGQWRPSTTLDQIDLTGNQIILFNEHRVGCIAMKQKTDCLQITKFYISPEYQSHGIGSHVLQNITNTTPTGMPIRLSVLSTNPAITFYQRAGFVIESETNERRMMIKH